MVTTLVRVVLLGAILLPLQVAAKTFTSQYCEFQLPNGWQCALEGTEWVCQSSNKDRKREAIIILAAKIRGGQDSLEQYKSYLKKTKTFTLPDGKTQVSDPKYTKLTKISDQSWVDSLHLASEVPGFYTRYMATVKQDLGVAVTFSVSKDHYDNYRNVFDKVIQTLKVFRQKKPSEFTMAQKEREKDVGGVIGGKIIPEGPRGPDIGQEGTGRVGGTSGMSDSLLWVVLAAALGLFIFMKMKKGKAQGQKKKKKKKK